MVSQTNSLAEKLAFIGFPRVFFEVVRTYFRVEVEGLENVPSRGKVLIVPNHSGCTGLDAAILGHLLHRELRRVPRIMTLWTLFNWIPYMSVAAQKMGLKPASAKEGLELLRKNCLTVLFPEGVSGSFKPSSQRYHLQRFHTGFVRMALLSNAPVIPCVIIGAEESNINFGMVHFEKFLKGLTFPLPFNMIPLPAKWKVRFLPPTDLSKYSAENADNKSLMQDAANQVRRSMQRAINRELAKRKYIYFGKTKITPIKRLDERESPPPHLYLSPTGRTHYGKSLLFQHPKANRRTGRFRA